MSTTWTYCAKSETLTADEGPISWEQVMWRRFDSLRRFAESVHGQSLHFHYSVTAEGGTQMVLESPTTESPENQRIINLKINRAASVYLLRLVDVVTMSDTLKTYRLWASV